jgi:hypothetical protein
MKRTNHCSTAVVHLNYTVSSAHAQSFKCFKRRHNGRELYSKNSAFIDTDWYENIEFCVQENFATKND